MSETMAAIIKTAPKPGCMEYVTDFPKPEIKEDEILVQVKACGICGTDHSLYGWNEAIAKNYKIQFPAPDHLTADDPGKTRDKKDSQRQNDVVASRLRQADEDKRQKNARKR